MEIPVKMKQGRQSFTRISALLFYGFLALPLAGCGGSSSSGQSMNQQITSTTRQYVEEFYPLWFSYYQFQYGGDNQLDGPDRISAIYQIVVAINDDTLYASSFIDLSSEPLIVTIPATTVTYSILTLDPYGDIFDSGIPAQTSGVYGLLPPAYSGTLPAGITPIQMPLDFSVLIIRADKFSSTGVDQRIEADQFRRSLLLQALSNYIVDPTGGATNIVPEILTAVPFKTAADTLLTINPILFLQQLQVAVGASNTPPLSSESQALVNKFNRLFGNGTSVSSSKEAAFFSGAQSAYSAILNNYLDNTGPTNWITFTNIGNFGTNYLDRSSIAEFIQYSNGRSTSAYYHAFKDGSGAALDGSSTKYVLTFPANNIPQASRFWSVTAYTPNAIELISNPINKYVVASYTPGLVTNSDGSISIYLAPQQPNGVPQANWLPTRKGPFNVMLRVYGPEGSVKDNTYVPPAIVLMN